MSWFDGAVRQRTLAIILAIPCLVAGIGCLMLMAASECPADDFIFRGLLQQLPELPLPNRTITKTVDGAQGSHGGWTGGMYATDVSPQEVLQFYRSHGASCQLSVDTTYMLGGFRLDVHSQYWECDTPAWPWSRGSVVVFPQAGYINALKATYDNPPQLFGGITISQTVVAHELRQFFTQPIFTSENWPEGGTILKTYAGWCDPF